jgi:hypothetical protein
LLDDDWNFGGRLSPSQRDEILDSIRSGRSGETSNRLHKRDLSVKNGTERTDSSSEATEPENDVDVEVQESGLSGMEDFHLYQEYETRGAELRDRIQLITASIMVLLYFLL